MSNQFFFSLEAIQPQKSSLGGSLTCVTSKEASGFVGISFANLKLNRRGFLAPIWHPNANKLGYCVAGTLSVSIRSPQSMDIFTVKQGEMFFVPQGYAHSIENMDETEGIVCFALNHSNPETMSLTSAIYSISDSVFRSTFSTGSGFVEDLKKFRDDEVIKMLAPLVETSPPMESPYKYDIESSQKAILTKGGYLQVGTKVNFSALQGLGVLAFRLNPQGSVEPHWHTNAGELVYIVKGRARMTILSPNGEMEVLQINGGEGAFAPSSHFHSIENVGESEVQVVAFFNNSDPDYIGIGEVVGSYSNQLLASVFNTSPNHWDNCKKVEKPLVIVPI